MNAQWNEIEQACRDAGLSSELVAQLRERLKATASAEATPRELEMMKLMGTTSPDRLVHDVRNLLNEVSLLRALTAMDEEHE
jgi:hypothetical protein